MNEPTNLTRRCWLQGSAVAAGALLVNRAGSAATDPAGRTAPVIDCHAHCHHPGRANYRELDRLLIEAADRLGIDQLCCSPLTPQRPATVEGFRECNRSQVEAIRRFPDRILGYCYVNPGHPREAVDEVRRYVEEHGFIGVKLYNEHVCTEPVVAPVVETAIELGVPILHHAGYAHHPFPGQPNISHGGDLAELSRRYPEAQLICAHVGGGGDWEWTIKALRHAPQVFLDTSGSVTDDGMIEMAARVLGVERLLFGCDMSMTAGIGKIRGARLDPADKTRIMGGNMQRILAKRKSS